MLQVSDSALSTVVSQLTSAVSLATEANNGTLNASDLESIGNQLVGIRDEVMSLANTTYLGQYVFSGSQGGTAPYTLNTGTTPAVASYNGDSDVNYLETPNGQKIQLNIPGSQIFSANGNDVLGTLNALIADFSSGTASPTAEADAQSLDSALSYVTQQRVLLDNSLSRLQFSRKLHAERVNAADVVADHPAAGRRGTGGDRLEHGGNAAGGAESGDCDAGQAEFVQRSVRHLAGQRPTRRESGQIQRESGWLARCEPPFCATGPGSPGSEACSRTNRRRRRRTCRDRPASLSSPRSSRRASGG